MYSNNWHPALGNYGHARPRSVRRMLYAPDFQSSDHDCTCQKEQQGNALEQKIKANPLVFTVGALLIGCLLGRKQGF